MHKLSFNSKDLYVPKIQDGRWVASLSDGTTVFENRIPNEISAWRRLKKYISDQKLKITNLRLEAFERTVVLIPYYDDNKNAQLNGYWQASKEDRWLNANLPSRFYRGIGYVKAHNIYIAWICDNGQISLEERPVYRKNKEDVQVIDAGIIWNDEI